jgi:hypothetical protein
VTVSDWSALANLATALGTLVLAVATFSAVRASNLMAKVTQQQFLAQMRPVLSPSRAEDPSLKVSFGDQKWVRIPGGGAVGEVSVSRRSGDPDYPIVYLAIGLRNAGNGIAVLHGWRFFPGRLREEDHARPDEFQRQTRDLYIPVGDIGFWQGAFRDPEAEGYAEARRTIEAREPWTLELLYGDHEGEQRAITRFLVYPASWHDGEDADAGPRWLASATRHWSIDRPGPR